MECPHCGNLDAKVIDSRLTKREFAIWRRRQCLSCSGRFTTYESTEERLLPFLISKKARDGATIRDLKTMLSKVVSEEIKKQRKTLAPQEAKRKARQRRIAKRRAASLLVTETVLKVIRRHTRGLDISKLRDKTGFDSEKIRKIVFELRRQGKIKSPRRGFYPKA